MDVRPLLARTELFEGLDADALDTLAAEATLLSMQRNVVVFGEGDPADQLFLVRSGRIAIVKRSQEGRESVVALMEPGDLFGELSLFDNATRSAGARALEASELVAVSFDGVRGLIRSRPEMLWGVVALLARRLRSTDAALADSMFLDVPGRTAKRLLELAAGADEFALPITQEELAGMVGASRERVNKALSQFIRLGWLTMNDRRYRITDRVQLENRAH